MCGLATYPGGFSYLGPFEGLDELQQTLAIAVS